MINRHGRRNQDSVDSADSVGRPSMATTDSNATPRPTPAPGPRNLANADHSVLRDANPGVSSSKRLVPGGSTATRAVSPIPQQSMPVRSSSRAEGALKDLLPTTGSVSKPHTSPLKSTTVHGRTYDAKLVSAEMQRLANLQHQTSAPPPMQQLVPPPPSTTAVQTATSSTLSVATSTSTENKPWMSLQIGVLPLFNGQPLQKTIEDLNALARAHIETVMRAGYSKALYTLESDTTELITNGMVTLNAKLIGIEDSKLIGRVVEIWGFFWDQVLPYVEGILLPLQTHHLLSSLHRPKTHRTSSPTRQTAAKPQISAQCIKGSSPRIDVRSVALRAFRDRIIIPLYPRIHARLSLPNLEDVYDDKRDYQQPRLQQMILVLSSEGRMLEPISLSLDSPIQPAPRGESMMAELLNLVRRTKRNTAKSNKLGVPTNRVGLSPAMSMGPSFVSSGLPRDRRGRIGNKSYTVPALNGDKNFNGGSVRPGFHPNALDAGQELLDSLRSGVPHDDPAYDDDDGDGDDDEDSGEPSSSHTSMQEDDDEAEASPLVEPRKDRGTPNSGPKPDLTRRKT